MSRLQLLVDIDLLPVVLLHIRSRHDLLSLALTCRCFKDIIIPDALFSHIRLMSVTRTHNLSTEGTSESFRQLIMEADTRYADAVRWAEISGSTKFDVRDEWRDIFKQRMKNLHTLALRVSNVIFDLSIYVLDQTRLRYLTVEICEGSALAAVQDLSNLHGLSLGFWSAYQLTPDSPLGKILFNLRGTLKALSLHDVVWQLHPTSSTQARSESEFAWPHVRELHLRITNPEESLSPDLARVFPSVRSFYLPAPSPRAGHTTHVVHDAFFVSRLESLRGKWSDIKFAVDAGARLRRAVVLLVDQDFTVPLESYLVPSLESLTLKCERSLRQYPLGRLSVVVPGLTFLRLRFAVTSSISLAEALEWILDSISSLPLKYIRISCNLLGATNFEGRTNTPDAKIEGYVKSFAETASTSCPSLRAFCAEWSNGRLDWHRSISEHGAVGFCHVHKEDGMADEMWYDWGETRDFIPWNAGVTGG
ncbi:hypothetical protein BOTBODRAFT_54896 [Botryobasidium botryosum FD-172 SS1]|uniref:F-box domain-containing protein n=1 Tax=Botryobasidium botryosum (strain FD-172 SS1) TaxID=930990 RepID=A0A067MSZ9_BOTB1|nr:hypothetical protein BOTBODRAFT_54896 [Botryobasidium botryosum FD-172 SS1]